MARGAVERDVHSPQIVPVEIVFGQEPRRVRVKCLAEIPPDLLAIVERELGPNAATHVDSRLARLSRSERAVLEHLVDGLTNRQIAERMFLAPKTVKNYVSSLLAKLEMTRRTEAAVFGARLRESGPSVDVDRTVIGIRSPLSA
jgi:DNA-binding NarL/FixJ family response regulator